MRKKKIKIRIQKADGAVKCYDQRLDLSLIFLTDGKPVESITKSASIFPKISD
ncbi:hypothetical protein PLAN_120220 [Planktothrix rubescens CCAP 1459/22]|uniref:Uncharacterized protein n=2 Tax=Planktothrix TaxID=54304 RepID=A0A1J1JFJ4_PLAAG|nr:hypothetical protein PLAN_120220 [Planktothrix rubescens NIVA-CYA 18]CUM60147.1 protein of unknown function [Planktothrix agardhii]